MAANIDVVILDEDKFVGKLPVTHQLGNLLEDALAGFIARMGFPGEDELNGTFRIVRHRGELLNVRQKEIRPLIGGEAPRKSNRERIRAENPAHAFGRFSPVPGLLNCAGAHKIQQLRLQAEMRFPQFAVVDFLDTLPYSRITAVLVPAGPEVPVVKPEHLRRKPRRDVHSVCDMSDRNCIFRFIRIQSCPHGAGHLPMQG